MRWELPYQHTLPAPTIPYIPLHLLMCGCGVNPCSCEGRLLSAERRNERVAQHNRAIARELRRLDNSLEHLVMLQELVIAINNAKKAAEPIEIIETEIVMSGGDPDFSI